MIGFRQLAKIKLQYLFCPHFIYGLRKYYEIVNGSPPSIGILPHRCTFFYRNVFLLKKLSNLPSFRAI